MWIGLYLSKRIAIPIRALAEASTKCRKETCAFRWTARLRTNLKYLVHSFNRMTSQLYESSEKLERTNEDLHSSNQALEERRRYTEAVLQEHSDGCHFHYFRPQNQPCQHSRPAHVQSAISR